MDKRPAERTKITKRLIDSLNQTENGQTFLRDAELPGFGLRITKGAKTFILEKRINGRPRRISIGPYGPLTLEEARTKAKELVGQIAAVQDPAQERLDRKRELTLGDLVQ